MAIEPLITKLNHNAQSAQEALRSQLSTKIEQLAAHLGNFSGDELREELAGLVEEFLSQFAASYQDLIATVEEEMPVGVPPPKPPKSRKKAAKKEPASSEKPEFVKPTFVHKAFTGEGLRVAKDARPALIEVLNAAIKKDIDRIKQQLPTFQKGAKEGEKKRVTVNAEDVARLQEELRPEARSTGAPASERELATIPLGGVAPNCTLLVVLRRANA